MVVLSDSWNVIWARVKSSGGGSLFGGKVRNTYVEGSRFVVRLVRRVMRELSPGAEAGAVMSDISAIGNPKQDNYRCGPGSGEENGQIT